MKILFFRVYLENIHFSEPALRGIYPETSEGYVLETLSVTIQDWADKNPFIDQIYERSTVHYGKTMWTLAPRVEALLKSGFECEEREPNQTGELFVLWFRVPVTVHEQLSAQLGPLKLIFDEYDEARMRSFFERANGEEG